jgi:hypothetical protein
MMCNTYSGGRSVASSGRTSSARRAEPDAAATANSDYEV